MKNIKQLRAEITEATTTQANKLDVLVRSGLFEENKLTLLRRALDEGNTKLTNHERKALQALSEKLIDALAEGTIIGGDYEEILCETDEQLQEAKKYANPLTKMPPILVLKRRSIRVFGPGNTVAMYWSDDLQRYIAVPFEQTPILAEAYTTWAQDKGYENVIKRSNSSDPVVREQALKDLVVQRDRLIKQYGRDAFVKLHSSLVKRVPTRAKTMLKNVEDKIADETRGAVGNFAQTYGKTNSLSIAAGVALGGLVRKPFAKKEVKNLQKRLNSLRQSIKNRYLMPTIKENFSNKVKTLREDTYTPLEMAIDAGGMWGPASLPAALASMSINALQGDWEEIPYDILGAIPEVGAGAKLARRAVKTAKLLDRAQDAAGASRGVDIDVPQREIDAAKKAEDDRVARERNTETPEQKKKREEDEKKKRKDDEVQKKKRELGLELATSYGIPPSLGQMGQQTSQQTSPDGRPITGFGSQVASIDPFASQVRPGQAALNARILAAKRLALSEQNLTERINLRRLFSGITRGLLRSGIADYQASRSGGGGWGYNKQRPQTGFTKAITPEDSFARAIRAGYYDTGAGAADMGQLNRAFMRGGMKSESVLPELYNLIKEDAATKTINIGNDSILVTKSMASSIVGLFESVNDENKAKLNKLLNEDTDKFYKVLDFAVRH